MDGCAHELRPFASYIWVTACVPGFKEHLYLDVPTVNRHGSQTAGHIQEDHVIRISLTVQLILQVLPDTLR